MFCKKCGKEFQDAVKFCDECGTHIGDEETKESFSSPMISYKSVFIEKDEQLLGILGDGYTNATSVEKKAKEVNALLTDKRLYLQGPMSVGTMGRKAMSSGIREKVLEIKDIISTEIVFHRTNQYIVRGILVLVYALVIFFVRKSLYYVEDIFLLLSLFCFIVGVVNLVRGLYRKKKLFAIEYTGGMIQFNIKNVDGPEAEKFLMIINSAKAKKKE